MAINILEKANINRSEQWILVRGKSSSAPLIIHVQAGPGLPIIPEANQMEKLLHLEDDFLVAYWDQRGCGKSFHKNMDPKTINFSQLTDDIICCTQHLLQKYKKDQAILVGYSIGATTSLLAAVKASRHFSQLFLVGIDIDIAKANRHSFEFIMNKVKEKNNRKLIKKGIEVGKDSVLDTEKFQQRAKLLTDLGGIKTGSSYNQLVMTTLKNMLLSKAYRLKDILKTIQGMQFCQDALLPELDTLNLFRSVKEVPVPVHFIQGKQDGIAPYQTAVNYYEYLQADIKTFTSFENSAHMPHYEEPGKFLTLIKDTIAKTNLRISNC